MVGTGAVTSQASRRYALTALAAVLLILLTAGCDSGEPPPGTPTPTESSPVRGKDLIAGRATFYGSQGDDAAAAIMAGDFNGDGAQDVVLGAALADGPDDARPDGGEAYLFLGPFRPGDQRDAGEGQQEMTVYGATADDQLARAMAAGDANGDGIDDLILGAPFGDGPAEDRTDAGEVYVLLGSPALGRDSHEIDLSMETAGATIYGAGKEDLAGFALAVADVSGDGTGDVIVGAFWADGPDDSRSRGGEVYAFFGSKSLGGALDLRRVRPDVIVYGANGDDRLGEAVSVGDVNGDGIQDLVLPAPFAAGLQNQAEVAGQTYAILGPPPAEIDIARGEQDLTVYGTDTGDQLGHSLGSGDVDGDGFGDILLAAVSSDGLANEAPLAGEAALALGRDLETDAQGAVVDTAAGDAASVIYAGSAGDRLGRSAAVGDVSGDGLADMLIAAPGGDGIKERRTNAGEVYVVFGAPSPARVIELGLGEADVVIEGLDADDTLGSEAFGKPVLLVMDMDGDGRGDLLVGAPQGDGPDNGRANAGEAYILFTKDPR